MGPIRLDRCEENMLTWSCLAHYHRGYFRLLVNQTVIHLGLGLSALVGTHTSELWYFIRHTVGFPALGVAHLLIGVMFLVGMRHFPSWVHLSLLLSVTTYLMQLCLLVIAVSRTWLDPGLRDLSWESPVYTLGLVLLSASSYRESFHIRNSAKGRA